jgi:hypothetical protein
MAQSPFLSAFSQTEIPIRQYRGKSPTFYRDANFMAAVFTAESRAVARACAEAPFPPLEIWPGVSLAALTCLQYNDSDAGPYNELSLAFPLRRAGALAPLEAWRSLRTRSFHAHVAQLPVTTEAALFGGIDYFGYPKYLADISFEDRASGRACSLRDKASGELILEFTGLRLKTRAPRPGTELINLNTYPRKAGRTLRARMLFNQLEAGESYLKTCVELRLGGHAHAEPFRELALGRQLYYSYVPKCEAILFMPEVL